MTKKAALFHLIKSLSASEKRYFRLSAQREDSVYLRLFDVIEKIDAYDERIIRKQFAGERFTKQLHVAKIYLSGLIMRSLRNYHGDSTVDGKIHALLQDAGLLLMRELYDACFYALEKAARLALDHERNGFYMEVLDSQRRLMLARGAGQGDGLKEILAREKKIIGTADHLNQTWHLTSSLYGNAGNKDLLSHRVLEGKNDNSSIRSETLRRHIRYSWYFMNGERKKAEKEVDALLSMFERSAHYVAEEPAPYITALGNKISMLLGTRRWKETEELLARMRKVPEIYKLKNTSRFTLRLWLRLYNLELEYCRESGKNEKALVLVKEITQFLNDHSAAVPSTYVLLFRFQFALIYYGTGDLRSSLREINAVINGDFGKERPDIQCSARLLNLAVHFELGNILVLRYVVDSTQRFLEKHKPVSANEKVILSLVRQLSRAEKSRYRVLFRAADKTLVAEQPFEYFDLRAWVRKHAE